MEVARRLPLLKLCYVMAGGGRGGGAVLFFFSASINGYVVYINKASSSPG